VKPGSSLEAGGTEDQERPPTQDEGDAALREAKSKDDGKKGKGGKGGGKGKEAERVESPPLEDAERAKIDPNYRKFTPGIIHIKKEIVSTSSEL